MPFVLTPKDIKKAEVSVLGGKGMHLAEMINGGFPVPEAYFITAGAYKEFIEINKLRPKIMQVINASDLTSIDSLRNASEKIKEVIMGAAYPLAVRDAILRAYRDMTYGYVKGAAIELIKAGTDKPFVAVRSSSVLEDIAKTSAAGQQDTFLNVRGEQELLDSVKKCWASLYTARSIYYRHKENQPQDTSICVIIQRMVNSESSGVSFTVDPINPVDGENKIVSEACWGLGETIVQGQVDPDRYIVDKTTGQILDKRIGNKKIMRIKDPYSGKTVIRDVPDNKRQMQILTDEQIVSLSAYCKKIEQFYKYPQDIEWGVERGKIYILQSRAVTALEKKEAVAERAETPLVTGYGASPGIATGIVKIVKDLEELNKISQGDVLVTTMTSPDMVPAMEKSVAIVTNEGGSTCHAAIVSRELGIPCIVGTTNATEILQENQKITVDAYHGKVFSGEAVIEAKPVEAISEGVETVTKIKVNLAFPKTATPELAAKVEGVGLLRLEHMLTKAGMHPIQYVREGRSSELTQIIVDGVGQVAKVFYPKPVWVRSLDARTDEFRNMKGGELEPREPNPMLGWHGIRRSLDDTDIIKAELEAMKQLHEQGLTNVVVMIPFTYDVSELRRAKEIAQAIGYTGAFGIMVEVPSCALSIEEYCKEGIDFISFGSNDLTQLTLGLDRNNERLIKMFDELHPGMKHMFEYVIKTCRQYNVETSICGEAPSNREDIVEFLITTGIDSLSVNIDAIDKVRAHVSKFEKTLLKQLMKKR